MSLPLVAITMGDPCGIGPEITAKVGALPEFGSAHRAFVIGDAERLQMEIRKNTLPLQVVEVKDVADVIPRQGLLHVLSGPPLPLTLQYGKLDADAGRASFMYIQQAITLANAGRIDAICTAPINKEALAAAGIRYPGHTEIFADLSRAPNVAMMLMSPCLMVALVTIHCSLVDAIGRLSVAEELRIISLANTTLRRMGVQRPRVAVAGLNPHAGEGGLFGREDLDIIAVAVKEAQRQGIEATGPHPPDTIFMQARKGQYDIVVAQYHDQGLIPIKLLGVEHGVNMTAGLPYVRTSPDHGTAFDIAGRGVADPTSLKTALEMARDLALRS